MKILILITLMALYGCTTINKVTGCEVVDTDKEKETSKLDGGK